MTTRTDVHRPSAINPADYRWVAFDYLRHVQADDQPLDMSNCSWLQQEQEKIRQDMLRTGGTWSDHAHGGNCMVCGNANALYTACFHHAPTNSYVRMGSDCSHHCEASLDHDAFMRFRNRVSRWIERENRIPELEAILRSRGLEVFLPLVRMAGTDVPNHYEEKTAHSMFYQFSRYGSLTDRQWSYLGVLRDRVNARNNPQAAATLTAAPIRPNQYPGECTRCHQQVEANAGTIERNAEGRWTVHHLDGQCPQEAPPSNVGELSGIIALFERAGQHLRRPAIVLNVPGGRGIRITRRATGGLHVVDDNTRAYLGRITEAGVSTISPRTFNADNIVARLREFAADPARVAGEAGRLAGRCCFCRLPLDDPRSTAVGYGPICAGHYGLPWGTRPTEFAAPVAETGGVVPRQQETIARAMSSAVQDQCRELERQRQPIVTQRLIEESAQRLARVNELVAQRTGQPTTQLDLNFDAAAERLRRINAGHQCPGCEGVRIETRATNRWACQECGVTWSHQEVAQ